MHPTIASVVEGQGDVRAVPILLRRLAQRRGVTDVVVPTPIRCRKSKIVRPGDRIEESELARAIRLGMGRLPSAQRGALLILLDADESCPARLGPSLQAVAGRLRGDVCSAVVLPKQEYEAWLLAGAEPLRGGRLRQDAQVPSDPESIADPKGRLTAMMPSGRRYSETVDQPAMSAVFDLDDARTCPSFVKSVKEVNRLLDHVTGGSAS